MLPGLPAFLDIVSQDQLVPLDFLVQLARLATPALLELLVLGPKAFLVDKVQLA